MRWFWSFLASVLVNSIAWTTLSGNLSFSHVENEPRETLRISFLPIRIERRQTRFTASSSTQQPTVVLAPPQPASLYLPPHWARQDFGYLAASDTTTWLDWSKQSAKWVPRVFLWQRKMEGGYMQRPSLQSTVAEILSTLRAQDAKVYTSRPQRVCRGQRFGWFLSYVKPGDDPPLHFEETLFMAGATVYRATYIRAAGQPEDPETREALNTLCWP